MTAKVEAEKSKKLSEELSVMKSTAKVVDDIQTETAEIQVRNRAPSQNEIAVKIFFFQNKVDDQSKVVGEMQHQTFQKMTSELATRQADLLALSSENRELNASLAEAKGKIQELQQILIDFQTENKEMRIRKETTELEHRGAKETESVGHSSVIPLEPVVIVSNAPNEKPKRARPKTAKRVNEADRRSHQIHTQSSERSKKVSEKITSSSDEDTYVV